MRCCAQAAMRFELKSYPKTWQPEQAVVWHIEPSFLGLSKVHAPAVMLPVPMRHLKIPVAAAVCLAAACVFKARAQQNDQPLAGYELQTVARAKKNGGQAYVYWPESFRKNTISYPHPKSKLDSLQHLGTRKAKKQIAEMKVQLATTHQRLEREKRFKNILLIGLMAFAILALLWYLKLRFAHRKKTNWLENLWKEAERKAEEALLQNKNFINKIREKTVLISDLKKVIDNYRGEQKDYKKDLYDLLHEDSLLTDKHWFRFRLAFEQAYPLVLLQIREIAPRTTPAEERLVCLIYLQLNNKQIGSVLGIGIDSVARSKRRLKLRIPVPDGDSLEDFIFKLDHAQSKTSSTASIPS